MTEPQQKLWTPPSVTRAGTAPAPKPATQEAPDVDPYYDEFAKLKHVGEQLQGRFRNTVFNEDTMNQYMHAAAEMFGEVGWKVGVTWDQAVTMTGEAITLPTINFVGRITPEPETDHERLQHNVVHGLADGQEGYIRPDGTKREDPRKKLIT